MDANLIMIHTLVKEKLWRFVSYAFYRDVKLTFLVLMSSKRVL